MNIRRLRIGDSVPVINSSVCRKPPVPKCRLIILLFGKYFVYFAGLFLINDEIRTETFFGNFPDGAYFFCIGIAQSFPSSGAAFSFWNRKWTGCINTISGWARLWIIGKDPLNFYWWFPGEKPGAIICGCVAEKNRRDAEGATRRRQRIKSATDCPE